MNLQQYYIKTLVYELMTAKELECGVDDVRYAFSAKIDNFSNRYSYKGKCLPIWWNCLSKKYINVIKRKLLISKEARKILDEITDIKELKKLLHFEHMTPMAYTRHKLERLTVINEDSVAECFKYANVILMTKAESDLLDKTRITEEDVIEFSKTGALASDIEDARQCIGKRFLDHGNGLFRLNKLIRSGVIITRNNVELADVYNEYKLTKHELD